MTRLENSIRVLQRELADARQELLRDLGRIESGVIDEITRLEDNPKKLPETSFYGSLTCLEGVAAAQRTTAKIEALREKLSMLTYIEKETQDG